MFFPVKLLNFHRRFLYAGTEKKTFKSSFKKKKNAL